jgi:hypothetical protein
MINHHLPPSVTAGFVITVIPCHIPLTRIVIKRHPDGYRPSFDQVLVIMYKQGDRPWLVKTEYSTDFEYFNSYPGGKHLTTEDGPCACNRRGDVRCREFGILDGTPEELKNDSGLNSDIERRIAHLTAVDIKDEERKVLQREKSKIYQQRAKEKRLANPPEKKPKVPEVPENEAPALRANGQWLRGVAPGPVTAESLGVTELHPSDPVRKRRARPASGD